jgi:hypothetical protein
MFKLKYLRIGFQPEISAIELNYFRGAVIKAVNKENVLFHNHEEEGFRYGYPLIQYKRIKGKPVLVCLQEGTEQIHDFFGRRVTKIQLGNRSVEISIENMNLKDKRSYLGLSDAYQQYTKNSKTLEGIRASNATGLLMQTDIEATLTIAVYLLTHRINHACRPNAIFTNCNISGNGSIL